MQEISQNEDFSHSLHEKIGERQKPERNGQTQESFCS